MGSCTSTPAASVSPSLATSNNDGTTSSSSSSVLLLDRAAAVIAELQDTQKLIGPVLDAQLATMQVTMDALGLDPTTDAEDQALLQQAKAQVTRQVWQQKNAMISQQVVTILVAVSQLLYHDDLNRASESLRKVCVQKGGAAQWMVQQYWPPRGYVMSPAERLAVHKSLIFCREFLSTDDVDAAQKGTFRISHTAYCRAVETHVLANQHQPEMVQFFVMGVTPQDLIDAATTMPDATTMPPTWLTYLDCLQLQSSGAAALGQRLAQAAILTAGRTIMDDDCSSSSSLWDETDWSNDSKNAQALRAIRAQMTTTKTSQPAQ